MANLPFNETTANRPTGPRVRDVQQRKTPPGNPPPAHLRNTDQAPPSESEPQPLSVSSLAEKIKRVIADGFTGKIRVVGEVSNFRGQTAAGHWFFSLKDDQAVIRCVCFSSTARKITMPIRDGLEVVATGRVDFYDRQGSLQIYIDQLEPVGQGALELQLRQLLEQLRKAGYFDPEHKRRFPLVPRRIAVITSRSAAALQDVINTASQRWPGAELMLFDVRVQGEAAAPEIGAAIRALSTHGVAQGIDAMIVTRGGGSIEDLWAFNEREVADALYHCPIPTAAAIGHETDTTVAELVADLRCATPTQAAMQVVPDRNALADQLHQYESRLKLQLDRRLQFAQQRLDAAAKHTLFRRPIALVDQARERLIAIHRHPLFARPQRLLDQARQRLTAAQARLQTLPSRGLSDAQTKLSQLETRMHTVGPRAVTHQRRHLDQLARHLEAVGPQHVLSRGYTYTLDEDGHVLRSAEKAKPGQTITSVLHDGRVQSTVDGERAQPPKRKPPNRQSDPQPNNTLFEQ